MIFGTPSTFAVEAYHEPVEIRWRGFGRMCVHIHGRVLGDVSEEHCSLFHAVERIEEVAESLPSLWDERFKGHSEEEIFAWLDAALYGGEIAIATGEAERFDFLTNTGEQFDGWKTFVYCTPEGVVTLLVQDGSIGFWAASCSSAEFRAAANQLSTWFMEQARPCGN